MEINRSLHATLVSINEKDRKERFRSRDVGNEQYLATSWYGLMNTKLFNSP